jgi:tetratricopeptide (TPR) repeat protein
MRREGGQGPQGGPRRRRTSRPANGRPDRRFAGDGAAADPNAADRDDGDRDDGDRDDADDVVGAPGEEGVFDEPLFGEQGAVLFEAIRPYLRAIALAALGAVLVAGAWSLVSAQRAAARRQSWDAYLEAMNGSSVEALAGFGERFAGTPAAAWARLALAENALGEGTELAFVDKDGSRVRLEAAADQYSSILKERPQGLLAERATLGLAKARESLGQLEEARSGYEAVAKDHPFSPVAEIAAEHARILAEPQARDWYGWFTAWKPPVTVPGGAVPPGGTSVPPGGTSAAITPGAASAPADGAVPPVGEPAAAPGGTPEATAPEAAGPKPAE